MTGTRPTPDSNAAATYLRQSFPASDRLAVVTINRRTQSVTQRLGSVAHITATDFQAWLREENVTRHFDVYVSMNALRPEAQGRTKQDIGTVRHIYLDLDDQGTEALEALLKRTDLPKPNYLLHTSADRWQVTWKVQGFAKADAEVLQKGLARDTGADLAATDCARVLRLPGYYNHKYAPPFLVTAELLTKQTYRPQDFPKLCPDPRYTSLDATRRRNQGTGKKGDRPLSQSEHDWAFAKRALARGESPALVVAAIASFRRFEKANPHYYADLTVRKAQQALAAEHARSAPARGLSP